MCPHPPLLLNFKHIMASLRNRWYLTEALCHYGSSEAAPSSSNLSTSASIAEDAVAFTVVGAGKAMYNGNYKKDGTKHGRSKYRRVGHASASCNFSSGYWYLCENFSGAAYKIGKDDSIDPNRPPSGKEWTKCSSGSNPVPKVEYPTTQEDIGEDTDSDLETISEDQLPKSLKYPTAMDMSRSGLDAIEYRFANIMSDRFAGHNTQPSASPISPKSSTPSTTSSSLSSSSSSLHASSAGTIELSKDVKPYKSLKVADLPDLFNRDGDGASVGQVLQDTLVAVEADQVYSAVKFRLLQRIMAANVCMVEGGENLNKANETKVTKEADVAKVVCLRDAADEKFSAQNSSIGKPQTGEHMFSAFEDSSNLKKDCGQNSALWGGSKNMEDVAKFEDDVSNHANHALLATNLCMSLSIVQGINTQNRDLYLSCLKQLHTLIHNLPSKALRDLSDSPWTSHAISGIISFCKISDGIEALHVLFTLVVKMGDVSEMLNLCLKIRALPGGLIQAKTIHALCQYMYDNRPDIVKHFGFCTLKKRCYKGLFPILTKKFPQALSRERNLEISSSSNFAMACDGKFLYIRNASGILKVGTGAFHTESGQIYGWLPHPSLKKNRPEHETSSVQNSNANRRSGISEKPNSTNSSSSFITDIAVVKEESSIGLELELKSGAVYVKAARETTNHLFWPGDKVMNINGTDVDDLDICTILLETAPVGSAVNITLERTKENEVKRLASNEAQKEEKEAAETLPVPSNTLSPGWLASIAISGHLNMPNEHILVESDHRPGFISVIDTGSMTRMSTSAVMLVGGSLDRNRNENSADNIVRPILSDGLFLYVLDGTSLDSTFVNIFRAERKLANSSKEGNKENELTQEGYTSITFEKTDMLKHIGGESKASVDISSADMHSKHRIRFSFVRCVQLSSMIKGKSIISEAEFPDFCRKSSFFTNGVRLHALFKKKLHCWSLKDGSVGAPSVGGTRRVAAGEFICFSLIEDPNLHIEQCQGSDPSNAKGHCVPLCFDRTNNLVWAVDLTKNNIRRWINPHPRRIFFGNFYPKENDPSIMLEKFTVVHNGNYSCSSASALTLAVLDTLQSPLHPCDPGTLNDSRFSYPLHVPLLVSTTPDVFKAFAILLETLYESLESATESDDVAITEASLLSSCRLLHTCLVALTGNKDFNSIRAPDYLDSKVRINTLLQKLTFSSSYVSCFGPYISDMALRCIASGSDFFFDKPADFLDLVERVLSSEFREDERRDPMSRHIASHGLQVLLKRCERPNAISKIYRMQDGLHRISQLIILLSRICGMESCSQLAIAGQDKKKSSIDSAKPFTIDLLDKALAHYFSHVLFNTVVLEPSEITAENVRVNLIDFTKVSTVILDEVEALLKQAGKSATDTDSPIMAEVLSLGIVGRIGPSLIFILKVLTADAFCSNRIGKELSSVCTKAAMLIVCVNSLIARLPPTVIHNTIEDAGLLNVSEGYELTAQAATIKKSRHWLIKLSEALEEIRSSSLVDMLRGRPPSDSELYVLKCARRQMLCNPVALSRSVTIDREKWKAFSPLALALSQCTQARNQNSSSDDEHLATRLFVKISNIGVMKKSWKILKGGKKKRVLAGAAALLHHTRVVSEAYAFADSDSHNLHPLVYECFTIAYRSLSSSKIPHAVVEARARILLQMETTYLPILVNYSTRNPNSSFTNSLGSKSTRSVRSSARAVQDMIQFQQQSVRINFKKSHGTKIIANVLLYLKFNTEIDESMIFEVFSVRSQRAKARVSGINLLSAAIVNNIESSITLTKLVSHWLDSIAPLDKEITLNTAEVSSGMNSNLTSEEAKVSNQEIHSTSSRDEKIDSRKQKNTPVSGLSKTTPLPNGKRHFLNGLEGTLKSEQSMVRQSYFRLVASVKQCIQQLCRHCGSSPTSESLAVIFDLLSIFAIDFMREDLSLLAKSGLFQYLNDDLKRHAVLALQLGIPGAIGLCTKLSSLKRLLATRCLSHIWSPLHEDEINYDSFGIEENVEIVERLQHFILDACYVELNSWKTTHSVFVMDALTIVRDAHRSRNGTHFVNDSKIVQAVINIAFNSIIHKRMDSHIDNEVNIRDSEDAFRVGGESKRRDLSRNSEDAQICDISLEHNDVLLKELKVQVQVSAMRVLSDILTHISADRINELRLLGKALTPKSLVRHLLLVVSRILKAWTPVLPESISGSEQIYPLCDEAIITLRKLVCIPSWSLSVQASLELHVQRLSDVISNYG